MKYIYFVVEINFIREPEWMLTFNNLNPHAYKSFDAAYNLYIKSNSEGKLLFRVPRERDDTTMVDNVMYTHFAEYILDYDVLGVEIGDDDIIKVGFDRKAIRNMFRELQNKNRIRELQNELTKIKEQDECPIFNAPMWMVDKISEELCSYYEISECSRQYFMDKVEIYFNEGGKGILQISPKTNKVITTLVDDLD